MTSPESGCIPAELTAGDSAMWMLRSCSYPARAGWSLTLSFVGANSYFGLPGVASGDDYTILVAASMSAGWAPGAYRWQATVAMGDERHVIATGMLTVCADLSAAVAGMDLRSHAQKVLDSINAWLESKAPVAGSMEIGDRKISNYPITELLALRDRYRVEVAAEQRQASGRVGGHRIVAVL